MGIGVIRVNLEGAAVMAAWFRDDPTGLQCCNCVPVEVHTQYAQCMKCEVAVGTQSSPPLFCLRRESPDAIQAERGTAESGPRSPAAPQV